MYLRVLAVLFITAFLAPIAWAKDVYILKKPKPEKKEERSLYSNEDYGFIFDLKEGYTFTEEEIEDNNFNLLIELKDYPLQAAITVELLDKEISSIGYWRKIQDRDPNMAQDLVYERGMDISGVDAVQVRIEGSSQDMHYLIISIIFSYGSRGYILSCFTDTKFFDKVPDFLDEVAEGFHFIDDENGADDTVGDAAGDNGSAGNAEGSPNGGT